MAALTSTFIVRLLDKVTGPAKQVGRSLSGITDAARHAGRSGTMLGNLQNAIERNNRALDRARGRLVDAAAGFGVLAIAIGAPLKAASDFETVLEDIGQKLNLPQDQFAGFGKSIRKLARDTTQSATDIAGGIDTLAGLGANKTDAMAMMPNIGKAATAYRAQIDDLANAGYAALDNLKVPADQFGRALDSMAQAGKAGAFELRDMAQYFPQLTAAYQGLGQQGVPAVADLAAALQITRKGAGDAASAATNLANVLQKVNAPQTRKAFQKMGVNLEKELEKAAKSGLTPIEAIAEITNRTLKGDLGKIGDLFADAQVQQGLRPLIQNIKEYREIRAEAMKAQGTVQADYERRIKTSALALQRLRVIAENMQLAIGSALLPMLADVAEKFSPIAERVGRFAEANPRLTRTVIALTAGLIGLKVAVIGVQYAALLAKGGLMSMVLPMVRLTSAARRAAAANISYQASLAGMSGVKLSGIATIGAGLRGMVLAIPGISALGSALAAIGAAIAGITAPVWAAIAAIALLAVGGAALIYRYWQPIKAFFTGLFSGLMAGVAPIAAAFRAAFQPIIDIVGPVVVPLFNKVVGAIRAFLVPISAADARTKSWGEAGVKAGKFIATAIDWALTPLRTMISLLVQAAVKIEQLKAKAAGGFNWLTGGIFGGGGDAPAAPAKGKPAVAGARAGGGPVQAGQSYLVGEQGPELWTAPRSGSIIPSGETMAAIRAVMSGGDQQAKAKVGATINITNHINFNGVTDKEEMLRQFSDRLAAEAQQTLRGLFADIGVA